MRYEDADLPDGMASVTVSHKYGSSTIKTIVSTDGVNVTMPLADFIDAVKKEIGSVTWVMKNATFEKRLDEAVDLVVRNMKREVRPAFAKFRQWVNERGLKVRRG